MPARVQREYDRKMQESKGPDLGLVGMGIAASDNTFNVNGLTVDPKSLYNSQKRYNSNVTRKVIPQRKSYRNSNSVKPDPKLDFNLSGINIPVHCHKDEVELVRRPPLPMKLRKFAHKKVANTDITTDGLLTSNKLMKPVMRRGNSDLRFEVNTSGSSRSISSSGLVKNAVQRNTKLRIARDVQAFNRLVDDQQQ
jgi:hypothetical protein